MSVTLSEREYNQICQLVYQHSRIFLGTNKKELVAARLGKRLRVTGLPGYRAYCDLLQSPRGGDEIASLVDVISTNHTFFFREKKHFEFLQQVVLPGFAKDEWGRGDTCLRCWSAACSSGEEPYSLAMSLAKYGDPNPDFFWELAASDICTDVLEKAQLGVYPEDRLTDVAPEFLKRFFQRGMGTYHGRVRVKPELRNRVRWHHINLFQESYPFDKAFHVIFCRNVMIYFDRPSQEQLVTRLARNLVPGGYLMIGHSESLSGLQSGLQTVRPAIYRKPLR
jgi:chemotaxis protein methyltransferase CheR